MGFYSGVLGFQLFKRSILLSIVCLGLEKIKYFALRGIKGALSFKLMYTKSFAHTPFDDCVIFACHPLVEGDLRQSKVFQCEHNSYIWFHGTWAVSYLSTNLASKIRQDLEGSGWYCHLNQGVQRVLPCSFLMFE